jgi:hypothetical protein
MNTNPNLNRRLKQALYSLRKEYGYGPLSVYTFGGTNTNLDTGVKTVSKTVTVLPYVILLPATIAREVIQSISQISANKAFVYGGTFDTQSRIFILERPACPSLKDDDWFVADGVKYEIKRIQEFSNIAYVVDAVAQIGDVPEQIFPVVADHLLSLTSTAEVED